jgi:hypothetical protein
MSQTHYKVDVDNQNVDDIVNDILKELPKEELMEVNLPSQATTLYGLQSPVIHIRAMTFEDEKLMLNKKKNSMNALLSRCIEEDLNPRDLLIQDKIAILFHLRAISVGPEYEVEITCSECDAKTKTSVDVLNSFPTVYADPPIEAKVTITLPILKKEAVVRRISSAEMEEKGEKIYDELWRYVLEIAGNNNAKVRAEVLRKLPRSDIHAIVEAMTVPNIGIDQKFIFVCPKCDSEQLRELKLDSDFFSMN